MGETVVTVIHAGFDVMVSEPAPEFTVNVSAAIAVADPQVAEKFRAPGVTVMAVAPAPSCITEYDWPLIVMYAVRLDAPGLPDAFHDMFPGPAPNAPAVITSQAESDVAVHAQPVGAAIGPPPNPPVAGIVVNGAMGAALQPDAATKGLIV